MTHYSAKRQVLDPKVRGTLYIFAPTIIVLLASFNVIDNETVSVWTSAVVAAITAVFAIVNGESSWRNAVYGLFGAVQAILQLYGLFSDEQWASISGLVLALLSIGLAGVFTPQPDKTIVPPPSAGPSESSSVFDEF